MKLLLFSILLWTSLVGCTSTNTELEELPPAHDSSHPNIQDESAMHEHHAHEASCEHSHDKKHKGPKSKEGREPKECKHKKKAPPPQALKACEGLTQGATCSFVGKKGHPVQGLCHQPKGKTLACRPSSPK